ncbi:hypothetical protein KKD19_02300 [Patescibacteria group bacterium]|nr:hypothetical protein [Patescibacteria group bacterium]MBU4512056.1 hypothetical protein [Patescibacteria group bacterium]MCG2692684.1 hypothetical protein [Candidatus Parcubacteria bacterium]
MVKFFNDRIKKLNFWDVALIKWGSAAAGLVVFKAIKLIWGWDVFTVSIWWLVVICLVLIIKPVAKTFGCCKKREGSKEQVEQKTE